MNKLMVEHVARWYCKKGGCNPDKLNLSGEPDWMCFIPNAEEAIEAVQSYKDTEVKIPIKCPICVSEAYPDHLVYCKHSPTKTSD